MDDTLTYDKSLVYYVENSDAMLYHSSTFHPNYSYQRNNYSKKNIYLKSMIITYLELNLNIYNRGTSTGCEKISVIVERDVTVSGFSGLSQFGSCETRESLRHSVTIVPGSFV